MSTAVLGERDQQQASARAQAATILDTPRRVRRFVAAPGTRLRPSPRRRAHARGRVVPRRARRSPARRLVAAAILVLQVVLLVMALTLPVFQVHRVTVSGLRLLGSPAVLDAAEVPHQSIFTIDADSIRRRVLALPWVAAATVTTDLPATVRIAVVERVPALRVRRAATDTLVAANGATMAATAAGEAAAAATPVVVDDRAGTTQTLSPELIEDLVVVAQRFPAIFGNSVAAYQWGVDDVLSLWSSSGWKAVLGHLDTADALAAVPTQLAALASLHGTLNFQHPNFGYIDLENPAAPAVGGAPGLPPEVQAAAEPPAAIAGPPAAAGVALPTPNPSPSPSPSPAPSVAAKPSASAAPTPQSFTIH